MNLDPHAGGWAVRSAWVREQWEWIAVTAGMAAVGWGWRNLRRAWMIRNLPTSRVRSVAMGLAELQGTARAAETPMTSPVRGLPCAWWRIRVTRHTRNDKGGENASIVLKQAVGVPFRLDDGTGEIRVEPDGAEVTGVETCRVRIDAGDEPEFVVRRYAQLHGFWSVSTEQAYTIEEWAVLTEAPVYVLGDVGRTGGEADRRRARVTELLKGWLASPATRRDVDANHDGIIQAEEWDAARGRAQQAALAESPAADPAPALTVRKPRFGYFLIAAGDEADALAAWGHPRVWLAAGTALLAAGAWKLLAGVP